MMKFTERTNEPWPTERLREARAVLADVAHHPDTRVVLAARVLAAHSPDEAEQADARSMWRILEPRASIAAFPQGGVA